MKKWAYYNEIDPFSAQWIRELIKKRVITDGEVDERSIENVLPNDVMGFARAHFFAGIAVWDYALRCAGWPDDRPVWTGSCPCQPFSAAGKRKGTADERHLWPAFFHLIRECRPVTVFGEQVASSDGLAWLNTVQSDLEGEGYRFGSSDLCAAGFGAPHIRQRLWFVADTRLPECAERGNNKSGLQYRDGYARGESTPRGASDRRVEESKRNGRDEQRAEREGQFGASSLVNGGAVGDVADTEYTKGARQREYGGEILPVKETTGHRGGGPTNGFWVDAEWLPCRDGKARPVAESGESCIMGNSPGRQKRGTRKSGEEWWSERKDRGPGPTNGFWVDAEWLPCRDGKARPVEPVLVKVASRTTCDVGYLRSGCSGEKDEKVNGQVYGVVPEINSTGEEELRGMWHESAQTSCSSHGRKPAKLFTGEFEDFVRLMPSAYSFAKLHGDVYTEKAVQALFEGCGEDWFVQHASHSFEEIWSSVGKEIQDRLRMGFADSGWMIVPEFPLVNGTPARVMRLRGYGNCINSAVAIAFISAYIEVMGIKP